MVSLVTTGEPPAAVLLVVAAVLHVGSAGAGAAEPAEPPAAESMVMVAVSHLTAAEPLPAELLVAAAEISVGPAEPGAAKLLPAAAAAAAAEPWYEQLLGKPAVPAAAGVCPDVPADQVVAADGHTEPVVAQMDAARGSHGTAEQADEAAGQPAAVEGDEY